MADASFVQTSFLGGEWSRAAQGRFDLPEYRTAMNVCLNSFPLEEGAWTRRSGTQNAGTTRGTFPGRVMKFDFSVPNPYTIEFTDSFMRFRTGTVLARTNDDVFVSSISAATPAVMTLSAPVNWVTGNSVVFPIVPIVGNVGAVGLIGGQFVITKISTTQFSLAVLQGTGSTTPLNGATIGAMQPGTTVGRIQEITTPYPNQLWQNIRLVQAETNTVVLQPFVAPYIIQVSSLPSASQFAQFSFNQITFLDGPYLDPFTNGLQVVPSAKSGTVTLTLQFQPWVSSQAYKVGDFVTQAGVNYVSLIDNNVGSTPPSANWQATNAQSAINNGKGFLGTDVGRLVRLFSEPDLWSPTVAYVVGNLVSYNPSNIPGASSYWTCKANNTNVIPGLDATNWFPATNAALWSWGKIIAFQNQVSQGTGVAIGNMTAGGGLAAAFDGNTQQVASASAEGTVSVAGGPTPPGFHVGASIDSYVGKNYTGTPQQVNSVSIWPSTDQGFAFSTCNQSNQGMSQGAITCVLNLRAKQTAPASPSDGTLLGTTTVSANSTNPIGLTSNDQVTSWNFIWVEVVSTVDWSNVGLQFLNPTVILNTVAAEMQVFNPFGSATSSNTCVIELLGAPLLYTTPIRSWRLGAFSNTTGWPTCGAYSDGRIWLGGAISNRFDASVPNGLVGTALNMAPTNQDGTVTAANGMNFTLTSDGVNQLLWMEPDQQGMLIGTPSGEWLIYAPTNAAIGPTNIASRRATKIGVANALPVRTDHTLVFIQRFTKRLMEYFADVFSGKFTAPNLAHKSFQVVKAGMAELVYTTSKVPTIWGRNTDGTWWGISYKRDTLMTSQGPTYYAWHRHQLGSNRLVKTLAFSPSIGGALDTVAMTTVDTAGVYHVEVLSDIFDEGSSLVQAQFIDNSITPAVAVVSNGVNLYGLGIHNGKTVSVWASGLDVGDFTVANGTVFVPFGDGIDNTGADQFTSAAYTANPTVLVGFTYTSQGQIVRPMDGKETGARNGPGFAKIKRGHWYGGLFSDCVNQAIKIGADFNHLRTLYLKSVGGKPLPINQLFSGVDSTMVDDTYSFDGMIAWQVTRPYPATIAAIGDFLHTQDK